MKAPPDHSALLGGFIPACDRPVTWQEQSWQRLIRFGRWYQALVVGDIQPLSEAQRDFVALFRGATEREPQNDDEYLWEAYQRLLKSRDVPRARPSGLTLRTAKDPNAPPRLENGDDDAVYFIRRRRR